MTKRYYRDAYGCTASISEDTNGKFRLVCRMSNGSKLYDKQYQTFNGARVAMGRLSDSWEEVTKRPTVCQA